MAAWLPETDFTGFTGVLRADPARVRMDSAGLVACALMDLSETAVATYNASTVGRGRTMPFYQATAANRYTLGALTPSGKPAFHAPSGSRFLRAEDTSSALPTTAAASGGWAVVRPDTGSVAGGSGGQYLGYGVQATPKVRLHVSSATTISMTNTVGGSYATIGKYSAQGQWMVVLWWWEATGTPGELVWLSTNGLIGSAYFDRNAHVAGFTVGSPNATFPHSIAEVGLFTGSPTAVDQAALYDYLFREYFWTPKRNMIVMVGDSLTAGAATTQANSIPALLETSLETAVAQPVGVVPLAIAGATVSDALPWMDVREGAVGDPKQPACTVVWLGTNDFPSGTPATIYAELKEFCRQQRALKPTQPLVVVDLLPKDGESNVNRTTFNGLFSTDFGTATAATRVFSPTSSAVDFADRLVKVSAITLLADATNATYYPDGVHLSLAGNTLVTADLSLAVAQVLATAVAPSAVGSVAAPMIRPASSTLTVNVELRTYDRSGVLVAASVTPVCSAEGDESGWLSGNLAAPSNPSTGLYRWVYAVPSTHPIEGVTFSFTGLVPDGPVSSSAYARVTDAITDAALTGMLKRTTARLGGGNPTRNTTTGAKTFRDIDAVSVFTESAEVVASGTGTVTRT